MRVWAIANQKGGVGKTTTAVSLGALFASRGESALVIDLDPHGSMTSYFGHDPDTIEASVYQVFVAESDVPAIDPFIRPTEFEGLALLPASTALATVERKLIGKDGMGLALHRVLQRHGGRYRHVLLDCPPVFGILMLNALAACDRVIVPVQTEHLALKGLERMQHTLGMVGKGLGVGRIERTVVPTLYDQRTRASKEALARLQAVASGDLWHGAIPVDTRFRDASRAGLPICHFDPASRGAAAYAMLADVLARNNPYSSMAGTQVA